MSDTENLNPELEAVNSPVTEEEAARVTFDVSVPLTTKFGLKVQEAANAMAESVSGNALRNYSSGRRDAFAVNWRLLKAKPGWNKRLNTPLNRAEVVLLAKDIARVGVREPINVYMDDGEIFISNGHRRLAAVRYAVEHLNAEITNVYVIAEDKKISDDPAELLAVQLDTDLHLRKSPLERGLVLAEYQELKGYDTVQLGDRFNMTSQSVGHLLLLARAPKKIHDLVISGAVSDSFARKTIQSCALKEGHDYDKAYDILIAAIENAKAIGKEVATPKHLPKAPKEPESAVTAVNNPVPEQTDIEDYTSDAQTEASAAPIEQSDETEAHVHQEAPAIDLAEQQADIADERKAAERQARIDAQRDLLSGLKNAFRKSELDFTEDGRVVITMDASEFERLVRKPLSL